MMDANILAALYNHLVFVLKEEVYIYITDAANGKLKLLSPIASTLSMLASLNQIYLSFGVHLKGMEKPALGAKICSMSMPL